MQCTKHKVVTSHLALNGIFDNIIKSIIPTQLSKHAYAGSPETMLYDGAIHEG